MHYYTSSTPRNKGGRDLKADVPQARSRYVEAEVPWWRSGIVLLQQDTLQTRKGENMEKSRAELLKVLGTQNLITERATFYLRAGDLKIFKF